MEMYTFSVGAFIVLIVVAAYIGCVIYKERHHNINKFHSVDHLIQQFEVWNEAIGTKQGAIDFYHELNDMCNYVFNNPLRLMITKEEFDNLTLDALKQLNREALQSLRKQINDQSFN